MVGSEVITRCFKRLDNEVVSENVEVRNLASEDTSLGIFLADCDVDGSDPPSCDGTSDLILECECRSVWCFLGQTRQPVFVKHDPWELL